MTKTHKVARLSQDLLTRRVKPVPPATSPRITARSGKSNGADGGKPPIAPRCGRRCAQHFPRRCERAGGPGWQPDPRPHRPAMDDVATGAADGALGPTLRPRLWRSSAVSGSSRRLRGLLPEFPRRCVDAWRPDVGHGQRRRVWGGALLGHSPRCRFRPKPVASNGGGAAGGAPCRRNRSYLLLWAPPLRGKGACTTA